MEAAQLQIFEQACGDLQSADNAVRGAAEAMLMEMRQSPSAIMAAKAALEGAESTGAKFQAALVLKDALMRDWDSVERSQLVSLRDELLSYTANFAAQLHQIVKQQLLRLVALMLKRSWLEDEQGRGLIFEQASEMVASADLEVQSLAAALLRALTDEFSFTRQSSIGLSWEYHIQSRCLFQDNELKQTFMMALEMLQRHEAAAASVGGYQTPEFGAWAASWLGYPPTPTPTPTHPPTHAATSPSCHAVVGVQKSCVLRWLAVRVLTGLVNSVLGWDFTQTSGECPWAVMLSGMS